MDFPAIVYMVGVVQTTRGIDRLLEGELAPVVEFVVQGSDRRLAHQKRQWGSASAVVGGNKARIIQVAIIHLVLAHGEQKLPARVVAMRIGFEPAGKRQAELDESAKRPDGPLRSNHNRAPAGSRSDPVHAGPLWP